ncbi:mitochondrial carrier domain-containing protein [Catenaria anguillulae PL171]|uniref:Mitochondrial carrier domain-containing protein n=1 Tax=Catenaria anguillulae PL171 TaxID=765915 RepID=A0A1Y2HUB6_9FUNG|nr:mitochondrial carrier domain-containing protein [Catenaria anguillulae PL171]
MSTRLELPGTSLFPTVGPSFQPKVLLPKPQPAAKPHPATGHSSNPKPKNDPGHVVFVGGTISGLAQVVVGYPFDSIKVMMQTSTASSSSSAFQVLSSTLKSTGLSGLFRGVTSPMAGVGFCNAVLFTTQSKLNAAIDPHSTSASKYTLTGALSGLCISILSSPMELIKVRMQSSTVPYASTWSCLTSTVRSEGVRNGLYRGWTITAMRDVPSFAAYFATYEYLTRQLEVSAFVAGGLAGVACWIPCYPQDVLKSTVQTTTLAKDGSVSTVVKGWVKRSMDKGGLASVGRGMWRGIGPTLARAFPANAATFVVFEAYRSSFVV